MVIKINNVSKWGCIEPGKVLRLVGQQGQPRVIRVELNTPVSTRVDLVEADGSVWFIGVVEGFDIVEFTSESAECHLSFTTDDEVWFFTNDGDQIARESQMESLTKVMQRRVRNPALEQMMFKMSQNIERRVAGQFAAREAAVRAKEQKAQEPKANESNERASAGDGPAGQGAKSPSGAEQSTPEGGDGKPAAGA